MAVEEEEEYALDRRTDGLHAEHDLGMSTVETADLSSSEHSAGLKLACSAISSTNCLLNRFLLMQSSAHVSISISVTFLSGSTNQVPLFTSCMNRPVYKNVRSTYGIPGLNPGLDPDTHRMLFGFTGPHIPSGKARNIVTHEYL